MQKDDLTEEELGILHQMVACPRWDTIHNELMSLLPTMGITTYGIWKSDAIIAIIGILFHVFHRLRGAFYQDRAMPALQSGIRKLLKLSKREPNE